MLVSPVPKMTPSLFDETHFHALACLLHLRDGGQIGPASLPENVVAEDYDDQFDKHGDASSVATNNVHLLSHSGHVGLKRRFLDGLAELASNKKNGKTVSCTAMKEAEDGVTIWITRNEGFPQKDQTMFDKLSLSLSQMSCANGPLEMEAAEGRLWAEMVLYQQDRIQDEYIPNLRAAFKREDCTASVKKYARSVSAHHLSLLRGLIFNSVKTDHAMLACCAYELRRGKPASPLPQEPLVQITEKLWTEICLLARLRVALTTFKDIATKLVSFNKPTIVLVPNKFETSKSLNSNLSLKHALDLLSLPLNSETIKAMFAKGSVTTISRNFAGLNKRAPHVHAEGQMLLHLCSDEPSVDGAFRYLGCSKLCCFLCARLLRNHGMFASRGCHGRVFSQWTVPLHVKLRPEQNERITQALAQLQKTLKTELRQTMTGHMPLQKTSVAAKSRVEDDKNVADIQRQEKVDKWKFQVEQERVAEMFRRQSLAAAQSSSAITSTASFGKNDDDIDCCDTCYRPTARKCSRCGRDFYCSENCEARCTFIHLFECNRRSLTTADYLFKSMLQDELPEEEDVLEDFGFNHFTSYADKSKLFGLYQGLTRFEGIGPENVNKWRVEGTLVTNIKTLYFQVPEAHRGGYFPWFLNHVDIFSKSVSKEESLDRFVAGLFDKSRMFLDPIDRDKSPRQLRPEAKADAYILFALTLHAAYPHPMQRQWFEFGFCTCSEERDERSLGGLYQALLLGPRGLFSDVHKHLKDPIYNRSDSQKATFTEFWHAFEDGRLIQLMDSKGLNRERKCFSHLEEFLSVPFDAPRPSVWDLKQFLAISAPVDHPVARSVSVDYGFMNCRTFEDTCTLMEIYKRLLRKADPLALHEACIRGKLFEFAREYDQLDEKYRGLMANFYPLK